MKWLMTFNICLVTAGLASAQSMPMAGVLPHPMPMATSPTVATPTLTGSSHWQDSYSAPAASCGSSACAAAAPAKAGGSALGRLCDWLCFRPCPPVHTMCVPQPPRAPLRTYFQNSQCGVGCANATDCGSGCGKGRGGCGAQCSSVYIPPPKRSCAQANCGGSPMWGSSNSCSGGLLGSLKGFFGLTEGSCGKKGCASGGCGAGGCSSCQYTKTPMSDIGQYHNMTVTQSVGRVGGLTQTGAAPAGSHYANPYRAPTGELQYTQPGATLAPATPMPPPAEPAAQGTNPFPGPNGTLPYSRPFTNP